MKCMAIDQRWFLPMERSVYFEKPTEFNRLVLEFFATVEL